MTDCKTWLIHIQFFDRMTWNVKNFDASKYSTLTLKIKLTQFQSVVEKEMHMRGFVVALHHGLPAIRSTFFVLLP